MFSFLNCIQIFKPDSLEFRGKRNELVSITAGSLFFLGWWIIIDITLRYSEFNSSYHICGLFGTLSFLMINFVSLNQLRLNDVSGGFLGYKSIKVWIFIGFVLGFSSIIGSTWILIASFIIPNKVSKYPGIALFLQNVLIFISSILFKFGRTEEFWR